MNTSWKQKTSFLIVLALFQMVQNTNRQAVFESFFNYSSPRLAPFWITSSYWKDRFMTLGEKLLDSFSRISGNTLIMRKTDAGKHAILSHFPKAKTPNSNSRSKHTPHPTILHLQWPSPTEIIRLIILLRGQSSSACFPPANRPVEIHPAVVPPMRSAMPPAMPPAVPHPNQTYKLKFMKNADAKLQAPHYQAPA